MKHRSYTPITSDVFPGLTTDIKDNYLIEYEPDDVWGEPVEGQEGEDSEEEF